MKLLVAVDASDYSDAAVTQAAVMGWPKGTNALVLTAVRSDIFMLSDVFISAKEQIDRLLREEVEQAEARLRSHAAELAAAGLSVTTRVARGDPRSVIVDAASEEKCDFVIVGSHGRSGLSKLWLGSVATHVVTHAPCNVLVVKRTAV